MTDNNPIKGKKIVFVLYQYPLFVSTMIINSIALLTQNNDVKIILDKKNINYNSCNPWLRELITTLPLYSFIHLIFTPIGKIINCVNWLIPACFSLTKWYLSNIDLMIFSKLLKRYLKNKDIDIIIPVECFSLIAVYKTGIKNSDLIYYNMELLDWEENNPLYKNKYALKKLEFEAIKETNHVMITSPNRAELFCKINQYSHENISVLPILPLYKESSKKTRYFRNKFSIPDNYLVVVYCGAFMPWAMCVEIINSMDKWPEDAVLVMHTHMKNIQKSEYFQKMQTSAYNRQVFFSLDFLCYEDLTPALSSADVGLLFYESIDPNFSEILFSSNKMAEYISAGIPVLCSPFPSLSEFVNNHGIGIPTDIPLIGDAIIKIKTDIKKYQSNVCLCQKNFLFEPYFEKAFSEYINHQERV